MSDKKQTPPSSSEPTSEKAEQSFSQWVQSLIYTKSAKQDDPKQSTPPEEQDASQKQDAPPNEPDTPPEAKSPGILEQALSPEMLHRFLKLFMPDDPFQAIQAEISKLRTELPTPCIQLLGEPQVGKSSVVRALTGDTNARIGLGDGVPVTERIDAYAFPPNAELPLWMFLDTPGLGAETDEDEHEFDALLRGEATLPDGSSIPRPHFLLLCLRADDEALHILPRAEQAATQLSEENDPLPVLVVQTCLHRLMHPHPMPYPFGEDGSLLPDDLPEDVRQQLQYQRDKVHKRIPQARFVVVDITDEEDEVGDPFYGAPALLEVTYQVLPTTVSQLLRTTRETFDATYQESAQTMIVSYATAAASAGALPPPVGDVATVGIALTLLRQLAILYRQPWELRTVLELLSSLGSTTMLWLLLRYLARRIPVPVLMAPVGAAGAFVLVFSIGHLMNWYYQQVRKGHHPKENEIRSYWQGLEKEAQEQVKKFMSSLWSNQQEEKAQEEDKPTQEALPSPTKKDT